MSLDEWMKTLILILVVSCFVVLLYPSLVVKQPAYAPGDIAERDIKASRNFFVEDKAATENSRNQAVEQVLTVYDLDPRTWPTQCAPAGASAIRSPTRFETPFRPCVRL